MITIILWGRNMIRIFVIKLKYYYWVKVLRMDISKSARISLGAKLDKTYPTGIHIGEDSYVASGAMVFSHDFTRGLHTDTYIGKRCFIGANAMIMPGIHIGDQVIVGGGSVVTKNVPPKCIVAGNPAKIIRSNITTVKFGQLDI